MELEQLSQENKTMTRFKIGITVLRTSPDHINFKRNQNKFQIIPLQQVAPCPNIMTNAYNRA